MRRALTATRSMRGGVLLITGEAGSGKTRLLDDLTDAASGAGMLTLRGSAIDGGGAFRPLSEALLVHLRASEVVETDALRPYRAALHLLVPDWPAAEIEPGGVVDPMLVLSEGVLRLLTELADGRGLALVIEDLHWADPDTVQVLRYLERSLRNTNVVVAAPALLKLRSIVFADSREIALGGLAADAADELIRVVAPNLSDEMRESVRRRSDGLPLLIEELAGADPASPGGGSQPLAAAIRDRVDKMSVESRAVIEAAAVIGSEFGWHLLPSATGLPADAVAAALDALAVSLLDFDSAAPDRVRWRHSALRDALLRQLRPPQIALVAGRVADHVLDHADSASCDELMVDLLVRAGRQTAAAELLCVFAERAAARAAFHLAAEQLRRAETLGAGMRARILLVSVLTQSGQAAAALEAGDPALVRSTGTDRRDLSVALARAAVADSQGVRGLDYLRPIMELDDVEVRSVRADALFAAGDRVEAQREAERALALAVEHPQPAAECEALAVLGQSLTTVADLAGAAAVWRRAAALAGAHGLGAARARALIGGALVDIVRGGTAASLLPIREAALDAGALTAAASIDILCADELACERGPQVGLPLAERAIDLTMRLRLSQLHTTALFCAAQLAAELGDTGGTDRYLAQLPPPVAGSAEHGALRSAVAAMLELQRGDLARAYAHLEAGTLALAAISTAAPQRSWGLWAVLAAHQGRWDDAARKRFRTSSAAFRQLNTAGLLLADAVVDWRRGDTAQATANFRAGVRAANQRDWWAAILEVPVLHAAVTEHWGDPIPELRRLITLFEAHYADPFARLCRDLLRTAGAPVPRRGRGTATVPAALAALGVTSRELDVLQHIRAGRTNAEIADLLFLSRRTVETHVANLLAKTTTAGRAQLPVAIDRLTR